MPPPVIAANRSLLAMLVATNFLEQNMPAIMATEAHYMEMWAKDAAAITFDQQLWATLTSCSSSRVSRHP